MSGRVLQHGKLGIGEFVRETSVQYTNHASLVHASFDNFIILCDKCDDPQSHLCLVVQTG